jgi:hypothetical protein
VSNKKGVCFENLEKENGDDEGVEEDLKVGKFGFQPMWNFYIYSWHSSDIRNTSIFRRCSKRSIFKYFLKNIIMIQRLENWPLYQVFSSIFLKAQKNV